MPGQAISLALRPIPVAAHGKTATAIYRKERLAFPIELLRFEMPMMVRLSSRAQISKTNLLVEGCLRDDCFMQAAVHGKDFAVDIVWQAIARPEQWHITPEFIFDTFHSKGFIAQHIWQSKTRQD